MDLDNIECVSSCTDLDGVEDAEIHGGPKPPPSNRGLRPATSVHELLECPVCTNSMYPPIHQVFFLSFPFNLLYLGFH